MTSQLQHAKRSSGGPTAGEQLGLALDREALHRALDRKIVTLLRSADLDECSKELLRILAARKGSEHAILLRQVQQLLPRGREGALVTERDLKKMVKELIELHAVPVGALRVPPYGYFLVVTPEDLGEALRPLKNELRSIARRVRALTSPEFVARLFRQLPLELDRDHSPQRTQSPQRGAA